MHDVGLFLSSHNPSGGFFFSFLALFSDHYIETSLHKSTANMNRKYGEPKSALRKNTGTFLGALDYMLQAFYSGEHAGEIREYILNKKREFSYSFVKQAVGGDHREVRDYPVRGPAAKTSATRPQSISKPATTSPAQRYNRFPIAATSMT